MGARIGKRIRISFPNGTKSTYYYDEKGQLRTLLHQDPQWRITGFDPMKQGMDGKDLMVIGSIDFRSDPELWKAFYKKYDGRREWCFDEENKTAYYKW